MRIVDVGINNGDIEFTLWTFRIMGLYTATLGFFKFLKVDVNSNIESYMPPILFILVGLSLYTLNGITALGIAAIIVAILFINANKI